MVLQNPSSSICASPHVLPGIQERRGNDVKQSCSRGWKNVLPRTLLRRSWQASGSFCNGRGLADERDGCSSVSLGAQDDTLKESVARDYSDKILDAKETRTGDSITRHPTFNLHKQLATGELRCASRARIQRHPETPGNTTAGGHLVAACLFPRHTNPSDEVTRLSTQMLQQRKR